MSSHLSQCQEGARASPLSMLVKRGLSQSPQQKEGSKEDITIKGREGLRTLMWVLFSFTSRWAPTFNPWGPPAIVLSAVQGVKWLSLVKVSFCISKTRCSKPKAQKCPSSGDLGNLPSLRSAESRFSPRCPIHSPKCSHSLERRCPPVVPAGGRKVRGQPGLQSKGLSQNNPNKS